MILLMKLSEILLIHMRIDLRSTDVHMPQHRLDKPEVSPAFQEIGGRRVPSRRLTVPFLLRSFQVLTYDTP